jgi:uncharacterized protein (DUF58 family)
MAAVGVVAAIDLALSFKGRDGLVAEFPPKLNMVRDREENLEFLLADRYGRPLSLVLGLELPAKILSSIHTHSVQLPGDGSKLRLFWPLAGSVRGYYPLTACHYRVRSPLGFWFLQGKVPVPTELHIYPDLLSARKKLAALFATGMEMPLHARRQIGQGREFEKLRAYLPGDSLADIHWKATAKRGTPITKQYQIERTQEVYVIIDSSRLSARPVIDDSEPGKADHLLEHYITASLILGLVAERQGDLFGLMTFSDRMHAFIPAKSGKRHFGLCKDALYRLHPQVVSPDFEEMATVIGTKIRRRALVIVLTSLDEPGLAEDFIRCIDVLSKRHLVLVSMLRPAGAQPLFSGPLAESPADIYRLLGGHMVWSGLNELKETLRLRGVELSLLESGHLSADLVSRYIDIKRRQVL